jgi:hypothetical protein
LSVFKTHTHYETSKFEELGFLGRLGLGFFNDISVPIYKGDFKILLPEIVIVMLFIAGNLSKVAKKMQQVYLSKEKSR